jgi:glycosyltransferase involved in cell wall biosynthesis
MSELLNIPVITHGLWHAGSYDPNDFLGRLVGDKPWIRHAEQSFIEAFDYNWLATDAHFELISKTYTNLFFKTGWPMEYTKGMIDSVKFEDKKNIIVFPHRVAPEKRVDLFEELAKRPELIKYEFRIPMLDGLTKEQYHKLLQSAKFAVSFAEQETLGISMYEAACAGAMPIVPDRLSYIEMYSKHFKHNDTIDDIVDIILSAEQHDMTLEIAVQADRLHNKFFSATNLINKLKEYNEQRTA